MYLKIENDNGVITFAPLRDDAIYVLCKYCGKMVRIENPGEIAWEIGSFQALDVCEECNDILTDIEDEERFQDHINRTVDVLRASETIK